MESIFPGLLFLGPYFAPLILRVTAALALFLHAKRTWGPSFRERALSIKEVVFGVLIAAGFLTQLVALAGILVIIGRALWLGPQKQQESLGENILLIGLLLALIITGAGAFAVDLPY